MTVKPDTITKQAQKIARENGWECKVTVDAHQGRRDWDVWVEFSAPTHDGTCADCLTQTTGPVFDHIEHGKARGAWGDGQCGGCGGFGMGWVASGAEMVATFRADMLWWLTNLQDVASKFAQLVAENR